jgi:hypothetical protein
MSNATRRYGDERQDWSAEKNAGPVSLEDRTRPVRHLNEHFRGGTICSDCGSFSMPCECCSECSRAPGKCACPIPASASALESLRMSGHL